MNQSAANTFENGDLYLYAPKSLKIKSSSPCINAGSDGTDIGMHGGTIPYKAGGLPFNPHINKSVISTKIDRNGKLSVTIEVTAQDR
jgi:hypothetical protein